MSDSPDVLVRGCITNDQGEILLVKHFGRNWWFFPGGHLERHETIRRALERELLEECGMTILTGRLLAVVEHRYDEDGEHRTELNVVLEASSTSEIGLEESHLQFEWISVPRLVSLDVRPASVVAALLAGSPHPVSVLEPAD